ncbi:ABC-2 type transport system ATP-binding protein [Carnobacterium iners]|uniref:ABC-2 type transport system ATP-binding protein n=1 Tax=Carnobacterium iners TaxID=1073423 RepID=A0A1X7MRQ6_9LACT|nr:ABC transporter ATP-binding protein [Carnobacterium iners]SEL24153.1 ABC-2 type transport system ATP-binding protein [Carnobacterium iners]SMH27011.1 ABC-2 type transport system ATP-binding protein [Carnobacterium iners]
MLTIKNISVNYGKKIILEKLDFELNSSEIIGLVAPNGAGKTTLLRTIAGLIRPDSGEVFINGLTVVNNRQAYYKTLYFVESNHTLYSNLKGIDHLNYVKAIWHSSVSVEQVIKDLAIKEYVNRPIKKLSLGMKQQILIAMCIVSDADVILLDEPMNGLDPTNMKNISEQLIKLKNKQKLILFSSHILSNVDNISDKVLFLKNKKIDYLLDFEKESLSSEVVYDQLFGQESLL